MAKKSQKRVGGDLRVGAFIREMLLSGMPVGEVLRECKQAFPKSDMTEKDVYWQRWRMKQLGEHRADAVLAPAFRRKRR